MKRKFLLVILLSFAFLSLFTICSAVKAAEPSYNPDDGYVLNGSQKCFFANGNELSITARDDGQSGATIFWNDGTSHVDVPSDISVFGGGHADTTTYEKTKITMNGGTVKNLFGGGLHESYVTNSEVIVNDGTITNSLVGGGANIFAGSDGCLPQNTNFSESKTRVVNATVTINNGSAHNVFGGGEGYGYTENAKININGGSFDYVTAGGSNGYTGASHVEITSGVVDLLQSVNRGNMASANMEVLGGTVNKLYVGGENDASVTGTIENVVLEVEGGSTVNNLYIGTSGGNPITKDTSTNVDVDIYLGATVHFANESEFEGISVTQFVLISINDVRYELETGKTLADLAELSNIKNVEGKNFVKFVIKDTDEVFDETTVINSDISLTAVYENKPATPPSAPTDNSPETGENNIYDILVFGIMICSLLGIGIIGKLKK